MTAESAEGDSPTVTRTLLLTDIEGSTSHWDVEPEAMARAVADHEVIIRCTVEEHRGEFVKHRGDGDATFSVFDRASDALAAAIDAQRRLRAAAWPTARPVRVRVAVHTGELEDRDGDYFGRAVNRAARLRSLGQPETVVLSSTTAALAIDELADGVSLVDLGEHRLRGLVRPEHVFGVQADGLAEPTTARSTEIIDEEAKSQIPRALHSATRTQFVGREPALAAAAEARRQMAGGERSVLLISGEPGIGKSRLAAEVAVTSNKEDGAVVLFGACIDGLTTAYGPITQILSFAVRDERLPWLKSHLERYGGELGRLLPDLRARLRLPEPRQLDAEAERLRQFDAASGVISTLSQHRPVVVVLDDLQWASAASLLAVRYLVSAAAGHRVLFVITYRIADAAPGSALATTLGDIQRMSGVHRVDLTGFDVDEIEAFIEASDVAHDAQVAGDAMREQTGGNPFFLGELLRHLSTGADPSSIPASVAHVLSDRIARLPADTRSVMTWAAIAGELDDADLLQALWHLEYPGASIDDLLEAIDNGLVKALLIEVGDGIGFPHALVRRAVLAGISRTRQQVLHERLATTIEKMYGDDLEPHLAQLTGHWAAAGPRHALAAARAAVGAANHALARLAFEEAVDLASVGLAALEARGTKAGPELERLSVTADLLLAKAAALSSVADVVSLRAVAHRAAEVARLLPPELGAPRMAQASILLTMHLIISARNPEEEQLASEALEHLPEGHLDLRARLVTDLAYNRALAEGWSPEIQQMAAEGVALARDSGDSRAIVWAVGRATVAIQGTGRTELVRQAADDIRSLDSGLAARLLGLASIEDADLVTLKLCIAQMREAADVYRSWFDLGAALIYEGVIALAHGDLATAERTASEILTYSSNDPNVVASSIAQTLLVRRDQARYDEALGLLDVIASQLPEAAAIRLMRAALLLERGATGDLDEAQTIANWAAADDLAVVTRDNLWPAALAVAAIVADRLDDATLAKYTIRHLTPFAGKLLVLSFGVAAVGSADAAAATCLSVLGRHDEAIARFETAIDLESGFEADAFVCRSRLALARARVRRGGPDDAETARSHALDAIGIAERLQLSAVQIDAQRLITSLE